MAMAMVRHLKHKSGTVLAFLAGTSVAVLIQMWLWERAKSEPATDWFEVQTLIVEDSPAGADPRIQFARAIKQDAPGTYNISVYRHENQDDRIGTQYCEGNGGADYKAGRELPPNATSLSWLMNRSEIPCQFGPGVYKVVATWVLRPNGYPEKVYQKESPFFIVYDKAKAE